MIENDKVRSVVARFFGVPENDVTENFMFPQSRLHGSVGRATLHAAIKRIAGVDLTTAFSANSFGELLSQPVSPSKTSEAAIMTPEPALDKIVGASSEVGIGIDIEHCEHLPALSDPWTEPFYVENFTPAEIAYCLRQPDPRESFCGLWSAKEAVKKCGTDFLHLRPIEIEIGHDAQGRPFLLGRLAGKSPRESNCLISISHSRGASAAVCVLGFYPKTVPAMTSDIILPKPGETGSVQLVWIGLGLGLLNLLLWLIYHAKN